jgi:hypothetical protein
MAKKGKRGFKFTISELKHLLNVIDKVISIVNPDWEKVWHEHSAAHPTMEGTAESLKRKFQELVCKINPTGDPNCPPYIREAKQISRKIVIATNESTGGSYGKVECITSNGDGEDENGMDKEDNEAEVVMEDVNPSTVPPNRSSNLLQSFDICNSAGEINGERGNNSSYLSNDDEEHQGQLDDFAAAAMPSSQACGGGEKRKAGDGANPKKIHAFTQPLKTPRKSLLGNSKDGNNSNGFSFGNFMSYMMYQNRVKLEQRDRQNRIDAKCIEPEYELCREELAVQQEENPAQRQLMNVMMMAKLNKNNESITIVHPTIVL